MIFSLNRKSNLLVIRSIWGQKCLNLLESTQSRAWSVARLRFREPGTVVADDVYPGIKHNGASVCSLYLLEKMESKINRPNIFWDLNVRVLFKNHFFSSLESKLRTCCSCRDVMNSKTLAWIRRLKIVELFGPLFLKLREARLSFSFSLFICQHKI